MKEEVLKSYIRKFRDKMFIKEQGEVIFTEPYYLAFHDIAVKEGWIEPDTKLDKGYLIRISNEVFKSDVEPEERPYHEIISLTGVKRVKFQKVHGFNNRAITGFKWKDQSLSPHCHDTVDLLGEYTKVGDILVERKSQYLHPGNPFEESFTKAGRKALITRLKCLNYDAENINHNRNVIHILTAILAGAEEENDWLRAENKLLHQKLDEILSRLPKNG